MSLKNGIPDDFSGVVEFKTTTTDYKTGIDSVAVFLYHYSNGALHRDDGPAVLLDGKPHEYWVHGRKYSEVEYGHFLEKKALKEKLEATLGEKESTKKGKI